MLDYRLVKTYFNRIFPVSSLSFFFLPCLVIFILNYVSVSFDISKKKGFWNKTCTLSQCGLSSIVEYGTTTSVVDCLKFPVLVNQCVRPSYSLRGSTLTYPQKNKARHSPYNVSFFFYETWFCFLTIFIRYFRGLTLFSITNVVVLWYEPGMFGSGFPKVYQCIIAIIYLRGIASFSIG